MRQFLYCLILLVSIFSCQLANNDAFDTQVRKDLENILNDLNIPCAIDVSRKDVELNIKLSFHKPYVVHSEEQGVLISYLIFKVKELQKFDNLIFKYALDKEEDFNTKVKNFDKTRINNIVAEYDSKVLVELVEYCMSNFEMGDTHTLDKAIEIANKNFPNNVYKGNSFFKLLKAFSEECTGVSEESLAMQTIVLLYSTEKKFGTSPETQRIVPITENLWKICKKGQDIRDAEKLLFGDQES